MKHLVIFEKFELHPQVYYVYLKDEDGNMDPTAMVGTHDGKGFTPNEKGIKMGMKPHPEAIPDGTAIDRGDGDVFQQGDSGNGDDV
jgi:hypothetical protein